MNDERHGEGGESSQAERFWERSYREYERGSSGEANAYLVEVARSLPPGVALELGCAEGGDAVWLAGRGWRVTAVDVSATALGRAEARAAAAGVADRIDLQRHDLARTFPSGAFDLVCALYLHSPVEFPRARVLREAARAVAPGGTLLIVEHASAPPWSWNRDRHARFPAPEETLAALDLGPEEWRTERLYAPERQATGPNGESATVTDNVIAVRRLAR